MQPAQRIKNWLNNPYPLWEPAVSECLTNAFAMQKKTEGYSIEKSLTGIYDLTHLIPIGREISSPFLELPSDSIGAFYDEHGLVPVFFTAHQAEEAIWKLNCAFEVIKLVETAYSDIKRLVKTIQIIQSEYPETDISYSHPKISFSIFISVCDPASLISDLRIAESILHEAMHLKLTLIENFVSLINSGSRHVYYSPWRDEDRPVRGVLHGMFVFRAISNFYSLVAPQINEEGALAFIQGRKQVIASELSNVRDFYNSPGLSTEGKQLAFSLIE